MVLTYGGQRVAAEMMRMARARGIRVVFWLCNFAYGDARLFECTDEVLVPSQFSADHYRRSLGLRCTAIYSPIDWAKIACDKADGTQYVTFVNPQPTKGVFIFARIAEQLHRRRPDIPLLVVEGRGGVNWLSRTGVDLRAMRNLHVMANTPDPRDFYRVTRLVLMPSLWRESFGRVPAEALINGIPVLASDRGALPEILRDAGLLFTIPECFTPDSRQPPSAEDVGGWIDAVVGLWDDDRWYRREQLRCRRAAEAWRPERLAEAYDVWLRSVTGHSLSGGHVSQGKSIGEVDA